MIMGVMIQWRIKCAKLVPVLSLKNENNEFFCFPSWDPDYSLSVNYSKCSINHKTVLIVGQKEAHCLADKKYI